MGEADQGERGFGRLTAINIREMGGRSQQRPPVRFFGSDIEINQTARRDAVPQGQEGPRRVFSIR
jgi:hypothetical protein